MRLIIVYIVSVQSDALVTELVAEETMADNHSFVKELEILKGNALTSAEIIARSPKVVSSVMDKDYEKHLRGCGTAVQYEKRGMNMNKTIFVVDDVVTNLTMTKIVLEKHYNVIALLSVEAMFEAFDRIIPDLILLDIEMTEMDGFEAIKRLKANKSYAKIPVIFYTSLTDNATKIKCIELGALDFIEKPCPEPLLKNRINSYMNCKNLMYEQSVQLSIDANDIETFILRIRKNIARLEEILEKKNFTGKSNWLIYSINNRAIKDALAGIGEWELSAVAEKLEIAGIDRDKVTILTETPGFLDALRSVIDKYTSPNVKGG